MPLKYLIVGNWKMHGLRASGRRLAEEVSDFCRDLAAESLVHTVLCPPTTLLEPLASLAHTALSLGGQDCHAAPQGAHTGDISAEMLADAGASYVIVGHSERRRDHGETGAALQAKIEAARRAKLRPILCIGETQQERDAGQTEAVLTRQLREALPETPLPQPPIVAYEPVWAIGSGQAATPEMIAQAHALIASLLPESALILYGGSVKVANALEILALPHVGGVLVGGASLQAAEFNAIIAAACRCAGISVPGREVTTIPSLS